MQFVILTYSFLFIFFRIITRTGMQSLIQHSMAQPQGGGSGDTVRNGNGHQGVVGEACAGDVTGTTSFMFDSTNYHSVHNLATNVDKRPFEDLIKKTAEAVFMSKCLKFNGFFGSVTLDMKMMTKGGIKDSIDAEIFISSLILRHLQIASTNGLEMAECILRNNDVTKFDIIPIGGAIFPSMSFFNHSCYPNALRLGYRHYQVIRVIR